MSIPDIIDNKTEINLAEAINSCLKSAELSKMAVGYFYLSGFNAIKDNLESVKKLKLLINNELDKRTFDEIQKGIELFQEKTPPKFVDQKTRTKIINNVSSEYSSQLEYIDQSEEEENGIFTLYSLIKEGRVDIRVFTGGKLHAKLYLIDYHKDSGKDSRGIAFLGSSNLTKSGIKDNAELNITLRDNTYFEKLSLWFDNLWENYSEPFSAELIDVIESSWVKQVLTPYDIYLKALFHLNEMRLEVKDRSYMLKKLKLEKLYDFQRWAFNDALSILEKYNGVFIADVVGLGKSYIASALIKYFLINDNRRTLIICPASLQDMWNNYNEEHQLGAGILPMSQLKYPENLSEEEQNRYSLLEEEEYSGYDIVVIDESHNFRNKETQRYKILKDYLEDKKVILLTATPQNKSVDDILNQFELFQHSDDISGLNFGENDLNRFRGKCQADSTKIYPLLENFVIRRRRKDIQKLSESFDFHFPKRKLFNAEYNIENIYGTGLFDKILDIITGFKKNNESSGNYFRYTRYALSSYLNDQGRNSKEYANISQAGLELKGFMKVLLFKRLESSFAAFEDTINRMISFYKIFLAGIEEGWLIGGKDLQKTVTISEEIIDERMEQIYAKSQPYKKDFFRHSEFIDDLNNDIKALEELQSYCEPVKKNMADDKIQKLYKILEKHSGQKILIFSEYEATAKHIYNQLKYKGFKKTEIISGSTDDKLSIIERFAPASNTAMKYLPEGTEEIEILVSTDVLSEGQNLQDASVVINYDIHWNPVRLIQRIGRVDRIGSENENIYIYNFLPEGGVEEILRLQERVQLRVNEIQQLLGEDGHIFTGDDTQSEDIYTRIYKNNDDTILDEDFGSDSELEEGKRIILELQKNNPKKYRFIKNLSTGIRCARQGSEKYFIMAMSDDGFPLIRIYYPAEKRFEDNIEKILKEIKCEPHTAALEIPSHYKKEINAVYKKIVNNQKGIDNQRITTHKEKQYLRDRLSKMYTLWDSEEYIEEKNQFHEKIHSFIRDTQEHKYLKLFRELKRSRIEDDMVLYAQLKNAYLEYYHEKNSNDEKRQKAYKIICSEIFLEK